MTSRYPQAVAWSAMTHIAIICAVFFGTYIAQRTLKDPPRIIELVAGPGDNFEAAVAPAPGTPTGIIVPAAPPVTPAPAPVQPAPEPVRPAPAPVAVVPAPRAIPPPQAQKTVAPPQRISKEEFDKSIAGKKQPPAPKTQAVKAPKVDAVGIARGVVGGSPDNKTGGAGGNALKRAEADRMNLYFSLFRQMLRETIAAQPGLSSTLTARLQVVIAADGTLSNPRITKSSGSPPFDQAILTAVRQIHLRPRPDKATEAVSVDINLRDLSAPAP